jgi:AICAR transformylase/IMP cyclohydrolase PurH
MAAALCIFTAHKTNVCVFSSDRRYPFKPSIRHVQKTSISVFVEPTIYIFLCKTAAAAA